MTDLMGLAREGRLDDARVTKYLDGLDYAGLCGVLQAPSLVTKPDRTWAGPRPLLADEDPAVNAAMARCSASRWRRVSAGRPLTVRVAESHPVRCGWCEYPLTELQAALDWGLIHGGFIEDEFYVWARDGVAYRRSSGRSGAYANPAWATFAALPQKEQRARVDAAVAAALPPPHDAWCSLRPDHEGPCPDPEP